MTDFLWAARNGHTDTVIALVAKGADTEAKDNNNIRAVALGNKTVSEADFKNTLGNKK